MSRELFGTDGVRGVAGSELTAELALRIGAAATSRLRVDHPSVLVVTDTRESRQMLQAAFSAGVAAAGGEALIGGVLPTPAAPLLLRHYEFQLAAVISASHNPYHDNGIKLFGEDGFKLPRDAELEIEREIGCAREIGSERHVIGKVRALRGAQEDYLRELQARFEGLELHGLKVALDCANGATFHVAPEIFTRLSAATTVLNAQPDGRNINDRCGSTHIQSLVELMRKGEHHVGFAFDGDGDRVLAVDRNGQVIDGDELIALIAFEQQRTGVLQGGVAVTVMTNYGFHAAMAQQGIEVASTDVGDKHVLNELRARGWNLGGEQSGHIIDLRFNTSGDGICTALQTLQALHGKDLAHRRALKRLPQELINVQIPSGGDLSDDGLAAAELARIAALLARKGRVLLRRSGTEPLMRVMVEAPSSSEALRLCQQLASVVERELRAGVASA